MTIAQKLKLDAGLYLIATPLGTARDITLRALDLLASADLLVAEDTRSLRKLMEIHGIPLEKRPVWSYHDHSGDKARSGITAEISSGKSVIYASEAGTPLIADPGYALVRDVLSAGGSVTSAPGPSAAITALTLSALPTDQFYFAGFPPNTSGRRKTAFAALASVPATLVFYESPKRLTASLADAAEVFGADRQAAVCRELTKKFEEVRRDTLGELVDWASENTPRGEIVLVISRAEKREVNESDIEQCLKRALAKLSIRDAADEVSAELGLPRRKVYQMALSLSQER